MSRKKAQKATSDLAILLCLLVAFVWQPHLSLAQATQRASISIDARKVENRISPLLYGQFLEFMYEGVKGGLHAELIHNRSFEEPPNAIGLSRNWERYPDDRNDDYGLTFHWDNQFGYPPRRKIKIDNEAAETSKKRTVERYTPILKNSRRDFDPSISPTPIESK